MEMTRRHIRLASVWGTVLLAVLAPAGPVSGDPPPEKKGQSAPTTVVVLKRGDTQHLHLCWDVGVGRAPAVFVGIEAELTPEQENNLNGQPRYEAEGFSAQYDAARSNAVQADLRKTGQLPLNPSRFVCQVFELRAADDACLGVHSIVVQLVSGTGRTMRSKGKFHVLIQE